MVERQHGDQHLTAERARERRRHGRGMLGDGGKAQCRKGTQTRRPTQSGGARCVGERQHGDQHLTAERARERRRHRWGMLGDGGKNQCRRERKHGDLHKVDARSVWLNDDTVTNTLLLND